MIKHLFLTSLFIASMWSQNLYNYNYQNYPVYFDHLYQGRAAQTGGLQGSTPLNNMLTRSAMRSLLSPAVSPNVQTNNSSFIKEWNNRFGYNFLSIEAIQENIGCRARCRRLDESPVCGDNMTRYFNSCDAECDQVTYGTANLRYNNSCCCLENQMALTSGSVFCVVELPFDKSTGTPKMILNSCMLTCLQKNGQNVAQNSDTVVPC
jgi:hypothetical protein